MEKRPRAQTSNEIGKEWEERVASLTGGSLVPGSGNQWYAKLDVGSHGFLWSCKATLAQSFRLTKDHVYEAIRAVIGPGGKGGDTIPILALKIDDEELAVLRMADFLSLLQSEEEKFIPQSKKQGKISRGKVPALHRNLED